MRGKHTRRANDHKRKEGASIHEGAKIVTGVLFHLAEICSISDFVSLKYASRPKAE